MSLAPPHRLLFSLRTVRGSLSEEHRGICSLAFVDSGYGCFRDMDTAAGRRGSSLVREAPGLVSQSYASENNLSAFQKPML